MPFPAAIAISLVFLGFGVIALYGGIPDLLRAIASRRWPKTVGLIEQVSELSQQTNGKGRRRIAIEYQIRYHYIANGEAHSGKWSSLASTANKPGSCKFHAADTLDVYFNPAKTAESRLFKGVVFQDLFLTLAGIAFVVFSILSIIVCLRLNSN